MKYRSRSWARSTICLCLVLGAMCIQVSPILGAPPAQETIIAMPFIEGGSVLAITVVQTAPDVLYSLLAHPDGAYLFHSANRGEQWAEVHQFPLILPEDIQYPLPYEYNALAVDPADADLLYVGSHKDLLRSTDGGVTWSSVFTTGTYLETPAPGLLYVVGPTEQRLAGCGYGGWGVQPQHRRRSNLGCYSAALYATCLSSSG